ncbi:MAG: type II toxin-antitoxin system VapC family toxin [Treponema sp.]|nr:type II toxin-antitoxin system VapC family toxin [Treponema sp.]
MGVIVDTCIWIDVERGRLSPADVQSKTGSEPVFMSPITLAELSFGVENAGTEDIRQKRISALERLRKKPVLIIDDETGIIFGNVAAALRRQGRDGDFRIQDLWVASQAIQHGFPIFTRNRKDFEDIPGLQLL